MLCTEPSSPEREWSPYECGWVMSSYFPLFLIPLSSSIDFKVQHEPRTPCSSSLHLSITRFWEHVVLVVPWLPPPPPPPLFLLHGASGDKLWMQRKSCKICCIFHYLHVKGHKSSSVKSAIKKWQVLLSGFFIAYYLQWQQLLLHHCTAYHIICS